MSTIAVGISDVNQGDIQKLARICGLLGSSHHGERAVAAVKASEILRANSLTWDEFVLKAFKAQTTKEEQPKRAPHWSQIPKTDREWIIAIQYECRHFITDWEISFLKDVLERNRWPLSPKQKEVLTRMREKYGRAYA